MFITVTVVVQKKQFSTADIVYMSTFWLCLIFGFFIIFDQPYWLGMFWLVLSCLFYLPMLHLPWYADETDVIDENLICEQITKYTEYMKIKRFHLIMWLTIVLPLYTVNYLVAMWNMIDFKTTIIIYQILSVTRNCNPKKKRKKLF